MITINVFVFSFKHLVLEVTDRWELFQYLWNPKPNFKFFSRVFPMFLAI